MEKRGLTCIVNSGYSKQQMEQVITAHITNVMNHYKGQCYSW